MISHRPGSHFRDNPRAATSIRKAVKNSCHIMIKARELQNLKAEGVTNSNSTPNTQTSSNGQIRKKKKRKEKPIRRFSSILAHRNPAQLSMSILTKRLFSFILGRVPLCLTLGRCPDRYHSRSTQKGFRERGKSHQSRLQGGNRKATDHKMLVRFPGTGRTSSRDS